VLVVDVGRVVVVDVDVLVELDVVVDVGYVLVELLLVELEGPVEVFPKAMATGHAATTAVITAKLRNRRRFIATFRQTHTSMSVGSRGLACSRQMA
jgi:hypothetical protein